VGLRQDLVDTLSAVLGALPPTVRLGDAVGMPVSA
jgi:hypothetical protein